MSRPTPLIEDERLILRWLTQEDSAGLDRLVHSDSVYRYLPTFLFERKYDDSDPAERQIISYDKCHYQRNDIHKVSIGYRFLEAYWGKGIASETVGMMTNYLKNNASIEIITASTMIENRASAAVLRKNGFSLVASGADEDWGFPTPTPTDKWIL